MHRSSLRFLFASALAFSLSACNPREPGTSAGETESSSDPTMGQTQTSVPTTTEPETTGTSTTTGDPTTTSPTTTVTTTTTGEPACNDPEGQANDASCTDPSGCGCASGKCFVVPALGGFCGECLADSDCAEGGCSVPNPIAGVGATCNMGGPGEGCMSNDICTDPANGICGTLLEVPGIITVATCGECQVNADCADPAAANCTPTYDVANFKGQLTCVADGSLDVNTGCSLEDDGGNPAGNKACKSGFCGEASVMGLLKLGICGECNSDADCDGGKMCSDPSVDLNSGSLIGSVCM